MLAFWILPSGEILEVPPGMIHGDVAEREGLNQIRALRQGWIRTTGSEEGGWNFEVWDIQRDETQNLIEDFVLAHPSGERWINLETWIPYQMNLAVKPRDIEGESIKEAIQAKLQRKLQFPSMGERGKGQWSEKSVIMYRGTPEPESEPSLRAHPCVFFAFDYIEVVDYATGGEQHDGYIQEYEVPATLNLLDMDEKDDLIIVEEFLGHHPRHGELVDLLHYPPKAWASFLKEGGYDGVVMHSYVCTWNVEDIYLLRQWKLEWNEEKKKFDDVLILERARR